MNGPEEVLNFWLDDVGVDGWYKECATLDATIRERFEATLNGATDGRYSMWMTYPSGALAYIILTDQFSRNMYRGSNGAFATDPLALAATKSAIKNGWDLKIDEPARQFFYLPLMHSENLCDQDRCVRLMCERMPKTQASSLLHARAHRAVIRRFGRFPTRNDALGRTFTQQEREYVALGGYGQIVRDMQADKAA